MKAIRIPYLLTLLLCILFCLTGCGKREDDIYVQSTYEALLYEDRADMYVVLGEQYYQGEAVRISCNREGDIFLHRDGEEAGLFLTSVSSDYANPGASWWLDGDGSIFVLYEDTVIMLNAEGKETARVRADGMVSDICRSRDGRLVIKINNAEKFTNGLAFLDMETGKIGEIIWLNSSIYSISAGAKQDILLVDEGGICDYNLEEKKKEYYMNFSNADYTPAGRIWDIHWLSEGQIDLLTDGKMIVTLRKVNLSESGKIFLVYKTTYVSPELKELIVRFNQQNENYYIRVEECPQGYDFYDFQEKISMEIAAGHGPDIINNNSVASLYKLLEMNAFEDLLPYMEEVGIDESAYYDGLLVPMEGMEGIYALRYGIGISTMCIDGEVLGTTMEEWDFSTKWDIDTELNMLETYDGDKAYSVSYGSTGMLIHWLKFSEDLYGMVDWKQRTCHFEGEKWERMVNLAKKYGYREEKKENGWIAYLAPFYDFNFYSARENGMWESNLIPVGYAGDTGGITELYFYEMYMNASSAHKEGVWQFFNFLLQEDAQYSLVMNQSGSYFPIHRQAFAEAGRYYIDNPERRSYWNSFDGWDYSTTGLTEEQLVRLEEYIDRAEIITWTWRTDPILDIIEEEMDSYYAGGKSLEEVSGVIENRVQLYLDELD